MSTMTLYPYKWYGMWVFDDEATGLTREAFVAGADRVMDFLSRKLPQAGRGFKLTFGAKPFDGHQVSMTWVHGNKNNSTIIPVRQSKVQVGTDEIFEIGHNHGNTYWCVEAQCDCWLCPALFKYFPKAPPALYARADAVKGGVTPTPLPVGGWHARSLFNASPSWLKDYEYD